jgi:enamine deaminase RidA (YjgF/YER057c/UK114 family)
MTPATSNVPTPKIQAVGVAGAATTVVVFIAGQLGLDLTAEVAAALTTLIAFGAGYLKS